MSAAHTQGPSRTLTGLRPRAQVRGVVSIGGAVLVDLLEGPGPVVLTEMQALALARALVDAVNASNGTETTCTST